MAQIRCVVNVEVLSDDSHYTLDSSSLELMDAIVQIDVEPRLRDYFPAQNFTLTVKHSAVEPAEAAA